MLEGGSTALGMTSGLGRAHSGFGDSSGRASAASCNRQSIVLRVKELEDELHRTRASLLFVLSQLLDLKDLSIGRHCTRLAEWAVRIATDLGLGQDDRRSLEVACMLHDVGKIGVPDAILGKEGPLSRAEWTEMKKHPDYGWTILRLLPGLESASLFILHHHERIDGKGYPGGLKGEEIPLGGRIVAVVDAFDAMISDRCYRRGLPLEVALRRLIEGSGTQFDADVVERFAQLVRNEFADVLRATESSSPSVTRI
jgi:HD-GYP domain-containing protein (c-di-GMP phosphodiesterase class II)